MSGSRVSVANSAVARPSGAANMPLLASWDSHLGPGSPAAVAVAVAVIAYGPGLAARLPWRRLLLTCWTTSVAWILALALVEGWYRGVARRLTTKHEYLRVIDRFDDIGAALRGFTDHIVVGPGRLARTRRRTPWRTRLPVFPLPRGRQSPFSPRLGVFPRGPAHHAEAALESAALRMHCCSASCRESGRRGSIGYNSW
jgi:hypothetical protein